MKKIILALALSLGLAACANVPNPISGVTLYQVKNVYAIGLQLVVDYRNYCWARPYAVLMADSVAKPLCQNRRANVRAAQKAKGVAKQAVDAATAVNSGSLISAAWDAVNIFRTSVPAVPQ
jgi:hypothetical protein